MAVSHAALLLLSCQLCTKVLARPAPAAPVAYATTFDYIIVGGGNAGLVVANRLSEDPNIRVAIVEAGTFYEKATGNSSQIPANDWLYNGKAHTDTNPLVEWGFTTTPQVGVDGVSVHYTRGKTLGGSSALNYMAYQRTTVGALQRWADTVGDQSWTYENVSPYYHKSLNFTPPNMNVRPENSTPSYDFSTLGEGGPLDVSYANYAQGFSSWVKQAYEAQGMSPITGFTTGHLLGSANLISAINQTTGFRESSSTAFLQPVLDRTNLFLFDHALAEKIIFDGNTATGVQAFSTESNTTFTLTASKEVIVSSGVFQSPQLLMVSGVGPADVLREHGIEVVADRKGVGHGLQDHVFFGISYRVNVQTSSYLAYGDALARAIDEFNTNHTGFLTSPGGDYGGYEKLPPDVRANFSPSTEEDLASYPDDWPEMQYLPLPAYVGDFSSASAGSPLDGFQYATILATMNAHTSRGNISIRSASMHDQPLINPNWLTTTTDIELAIAGFKRLRQIFETPVMRGVEIGEEYFPGKNVTTDEQIHETVKKIFNTQYHACATNKMGKEDDEYAVVDPKGRVYGVENLRVVDASIFPFLPPGLPMGTVYMLAEKISDDIKNSS